jgi:alpha-L-fucosidase
MRNALTIAALLAVSLCNTLLAQQHVNPKEIEGKMQWFADAKLGIFIHWGIYSLGNTSESWAFHNRHISHTDYMAQINKFTAKNYKPEYWAELIKKSGARYSVITSKHHDGVALWDTKMNDLSTLKKSPAKRDVLTPFVEALRKQGVKVGLYYSLIDWSHPDYPGSLGIRAGTMPTSTPCAGEIPPVLPRADKRDHHPFNPDLVWFDGDWSIAPGSGGRVHPQHDPEEQPQRHYQWPLQGYGDYDTPSRTSRSRAPT